MSTRSGATCPRLRSTDRRSNSASAAISNGPVDGRCSTFHSIRNEPSREARMTDVVLWERELPRNTGFVFDIKKGQPVRITSQTIIDFVCFNRDNLRERFDQARTKANQRKVFLTAGDSLVSKLNNTMMTIIEDTFKEGHHDLQEGIFDDGHHGVEL